MSCSLLLKEVNQVPLGEISMCAHLCISVYKHRQHTFFLGHTYPLPESVLVTFHVPIKAVHASATT